MVLASAVLSASWLSCGFAGLGDSGDGDSYFVEIIADGPPTDGYSVAYWVGDHQGNLWAYDFGPELMRLSPGATAWDRFPVPYTFIYLPHIAASSHRGLLFSDFDVYTVDSDGQFTYVAVNASVDYPGEIKDVIGTDANGRIYAQTSRSSGTESSYYRLTPDDSTWEYLGVTDGDMITKGVINDLDGRIFMVGARTWMIDSDGTGPTIFDDGNEWGPPAMAPNGDIYHALPGALYRLSRGANQSELLDVDLNSMDYTTAHYYTMGIDEEARILMGRYTAYTGGEFHVLLLEPGDPGPGTPVVTGLPMASYIIGTVRDTFVVDASSTLYRITRQ